MYLNTLWKNYRVRKFFRERKQRYEKLMGHLPEGWRGPVKISLWVAAVLFIIMGIGLIVSCASTVYVAINKTVDFLFCLTTIAFCLENII